MNMSGRLHRHRSAKTAATSAKQRKLQCFHQLAGNSKRRLAMADMTTTPSTPEGLPNLPVVAYLTEHDNEDMLWFDRKEAVLYCDENEPEPLVKLSDALAAIAAQQEKNPVHLGSGVGGGVQVRESVAIALWHRFAPDHIGTFEEELHKAEYRAAADAVIALIGTTGKGWQPIATAPKHTEVLCWREDQGVFISQLTTPDGVISTEEMERDNLEFPDDFEGWWNAVWGWQEGSEKPTHWMPLPAAPTGEGA
jgi:hypothetical protein